MTRRTSGGGASGPPSLSIRALNRALLARQHLLERTAMDPAAMVEHLVGMQAQNPLDPYIALWSRLHHFDPADLAGRIERRELVRMGLLRTTLHLATTDDALAMWPATRPVLERAWASSPFRKQLPGVDIDAVLRAGREALEREPLTTAALGRVLAARFEASPGNPSGYAANPLGYAIRFLLPVVQVPPRGLWGRATQPTAAWTTLEHWSGRPLAQPHVDALVLRYLAAFGPASPADARTWSWLTGLREIFERLRPGLRTFRDHLGRELFDLPDAPRPDPGVPAPPRFLPEYDNLVLSHQDRSRVIGEKEIGRFSGWVGLFLIDGYLGGQWRIDQTRATATLVLEPFAPLADDDAEALVAEGESLVAFRAPDAADRQVVFGIAREQPTDDRPGLGGRRRDA